MIRLFPKPVLVFRQKTRSDHSAASRSTAVEHGDARPQRVQGVQQVEGRPAGAERAHSAKAPALLPQDHALVVRIPLFLLGLSK